MSVDRRTFLGGSDAAAIIGQSAWKTPLRLYLEKRGEAPPPDKMERKRQRILDRGKREEPNVVDDVIELHGIEVVKRSSREAPNYHAHPEHPFIAAEVDFEWRVTEAAIEHFREYSGFEIPRELLGTIQNGEAKTMHPFVAKRKVGEEGTDEIPIEYGAQALHGLMVTGRRLTLVAVGVYTDDPLIYWIVRDDETCAAILAAELDFKRRLEESDPPEPKNSPDVALLFGRSTQTRKEATPEVAALVSALFTTRGMAATLEETEEGLKLQIGRFLLDAKPVEKQEKPGLHVLTFKGEPILQVAHQSTERVDTDKLRAKFPEVAAECMRETSSFVYKKPRKGTK
jgi:predicted phage-related endonuclease